MNKRREKKSKCIETSILHLGTKYKEITEPQLLLETFKKYDGKCFWCNCKLACPKLDDTSYENNYNIASLDRIDNDNKHHTIDNVNITCHMCNIMRGGTDYETFKVIIKILLGDTSILDLTNHNFINKLTEKRFTINYQRVKEEINPDNLKNVFCPISDFPIYLGSNKFYPYLPSWDRRTNNDENGNKLEHNNENIQMVCAFVNRGRNNINRIEDFIRIFDEKFPNRCIDIKVIYPKDYEYVYKHGCFVNKTYAETKLWMGHIMTCKQLFKNRVRRVILHLNQIKYIKNWYVQNKRIPTYKNDKNELIIYRNLSALKQYNIYKDLLMEFLENTKTQKEKHRDDWYGMYSILLTYIKDFGVLPINTCNDTKLWYWVSTQKQKFKKGILVQTYFVKLNSIPIWWWTEIQQGYLKNKQWFLDNPNIIPPKKDSSMTEYNWYTKIKNHYIKNKLHKYDKELIVKIPIIQEWINYECPIKKTDNNYKSFNNRFKYSKSNQPFK